MAKRLILVFCLLSALQRRAASSPPPRRASRAATCGRAWARARRPWATPTRRWRTGPKLSIGILRAWPGTSGLRSTPWFPPCRSTASSAIAGLALAWDAGAPTGNARRTSLPPTKGFGAWGLGWLSFSLGNDFEGRTDDTASFYTFGDQQNAYLISTGRTIFPWLALGATGKFYEHRLDSFDANGGGLDLGTLILLGPQVRLGLFRPRIWPPISPGAPVIRNRFPLTLRANLAGLGLERPPSFHRPSRGGPGPPGRLWCRK